MFLIFYFKQKTSYELRISDWSSDVCSSDLVASSASTSPKPKKEVAPSAATKAVAVASKPVQAAPIPRKDVAPRIMHEVVPDMFQPGKRTDRKGVGEGTSVSGGVSRGGRGIIKKEK